MAKKTKEKLKAKQRRAINQVNKYGLDPQDVIDGEYAVWPPSAASDLQSLREPPAA